MSRLGSYWLVFVIVAVGLALSWGQVGRKTERVLRSEPVVYLVNERPCRPMVAPCAALGSDRALVLGPAASGLILKQTGLEPGSLIDAEAIFLDARDREIGRDRLPLDGRVWLVAEIPAAVRVLRVRLSSNRDVTVGEFPLR
jgi:hypothetical protein